MSKQITQMMKVSDVAMDLWRANEAVANAKHAYHVSIAQYEASHGPLNRSVRADLPEHAAVRGYTAPKYLALQRTKRRAYSLKVRLAKECAALARLTAEQNAGFASTERRPS